MIFFVISIALMMMESADRLNSKRLPSLKKLYIRSVFCHHHSGDKQQTLIRNLGRDFLIYQLLLDDVVGVHPGLHLIMSFNANILGRVNINSLVDLHNLGFCLIYSWLIQHYFAEIFKAEVFSKTCCKQFSTIDWTSAKCCRRSAKFSVLVESTTRR